MAAGVRWSGFGGGGCVGALGSGRLRVLVYFGRRQRGGQEAAAARFRAKNWDCNRPPHRPIVGNPAHDNHHMKFQTFFSLKKHFFFHTIDSFSMLRVLVKSVMVFFFLQESVMVFRCFDLLPGRGIIELPLQTLLELYLREEKSRKQNRYFYTVLSIRIFNLPAVTTATSSRLQKEHQPRKPWRSLPMSSPRFTSRCPLVAAAPRNATRPASRGT